MSNTESREYLSKNFLDIVENNHLPIKMKANATKKVKR